MWRVRRNLTSVLCEWQNSSAETHVGLHVECPLLLDDVNQNVSVSRVLLKPTNIKFHGNLFSNFRILRACRWTGGRSCFSRRSVWTKWMHPHIAAYWFSLPFHLGGSLHSNLGSDTGIFVMLLHPSRQIPGRGKVEVVPGTYVSTKPCRCMAKWRYSFTHFYPRRDSIAEHVLSCRSTFLPVRHLHTPYYSTLNLSSFVSQVRMWRVCDVTAGGLPEAFPLEDQRVPRPREPLPHRPVLQGPHPHGLWTFVGAETAEFHGTRVQVRISGASLKQVQLMRRW